MRRNVRIFQQTKQKSELFVVLRCLDVPDPEQSGSNPINKISFDMSTNSHARLRFSVGFRPNVQPLQAARREPQCPLSTSAAFPLFSAT
jgi:hypothetical protein